MTVELTDTGYLLLPAEVADAHFPKDLLFAIHRPPELWLLPARGPAAGGLLMKQRNVDGDRSVLIWEAIPNDTPPGPRPATWDASNGALRVALDVPDDEVASSDSSAEPSTAHAAPRNG